jgi:hypothetical protein
VLILVIYLLSQTRFVCESYRTLTIFSNNEKVNDDISMTSPKLINDVDVAEICGSTVAFDRADDRSNQNWTHGE